MEVKSIAEKAEEMRIAETTLPLKSLANIQPENVEWLWPGKFAKGKLNLLGGLPDMGKSTLSLAIAATVTRGRAWPFSSDECVPQSVLLMTTEDGLSDTIVPRLMAAGADMTRISELPSIVVGEEGLRGLSLARDAESIRATLLQRPDVGMVVIDPLSAYLDAKNSHADADIRAVLAPITAIADETGVCILGIAHLVKGGHGMVAQHLFSGSGGIVATSRSAYMTLKLNDEFYMANAKGNLASKSEKVAMKYRIEGAEVKDDKGNPVKTSRIVWTGTCEKNADQLLQEIAGETNQPKRSPAKNWLVRMLKTGPKAATYLIETGEKEGFSESTLRRLKDDGVFHAHKAGFDGNWMWYGPEDHKKLEASKQAYKEKKGA